MFEIRTRICLRFLILRRACLDREVMSSRKPEMGTFGITAEQVVEGLGTQATTREKTAQCLTFLDKNDRQ